MDEYPMEQLVAELLDAHEQAFATLAGAIGDVIGRAALADALDARLAAAKAAEHHPIRDGLLATAVAALKAA